MREEPPDQQEFRRAEKLALNLLAEGASREGIRQLLEGDGIPGPHAERIVTSCVEACRESARDDLFRGVCGLVGGMAVVLVTCVLPLGFIVIPFALFTGGPLAVSGFAGWWRHRKWLRADGRTADKSPDRGEPGAEALEWNSIYRGQIL